MHKLSNVPGIPAPPMEKPAAEAKSWRDFIAEPGELERAAAPEPRSGTAETVGGALWGLGGAALGTAGTLKLLKSMAGRAAPGEVVNRLAIMRELLPEGLSRAARTVGVAPAGAKAFSRAELGLLGGPQFRQVGSRRHMISHGPQLYQLRRFIKNLLPSKTLQAPGRLGQARNWLAQRLFGAGAKATDIPAATYSSALTKFLKQYPQMSGRGVQRLTDLMERVRGMLPKGTTMLGALKRMPWYGKAITLGLPAVAGTGAYLLGRD